MKADRRLHWGVLGTGAIASDFVRDLSHTASGRAIAVGSRRQDTADRFGDAHGIPNRHASYQALVEDPEVEVVYIATPHPFHCDNAVLALGAGKPVLVEKPFTMNAAEARAVVDKARAAGLFAMEAMWTRFIPSVVELRQMVAAGTLGEIVAVTADFGVFFDRDPRSRWFSPELGASALLDHGSYLVSFSSMLLGPPDRALAMMRPAFTGVDGHTSVLLGHANGSHAVLTCSSLANSGMRASIIGTDGRIDVDPPMYAPSSFTFQPRKGAAVTYERPIAGRGWCYEADEVARCLTIGELESPSMPLDETVSVMETLDRVMADALEVGPANDARKRG